MDLLVSGWVLVFWLPDVHNMPTQVTFVWHVQAGLGVQEQREMLQKLTEAVSLPWGLLQASASLSSSLSACKRNGGEKLI